MTLIIGVVSPEAIWVIADRRLSIGGAANALLANKILHLDTYDSRGLIGYAGLGAKGFRASADSPKLAITEVTQWLERLLRGRDIDYHSVVKEVTGAANRQIQFDGHTFLYLSYIGKAPFATYISSGTDIFVKTDYDREGYKAFVAPPGEFTPRTYDFSDHPHPAIFLHGSGADYVPAKDIFFLRRTAVRAQERVREVDWPRHIHSVSAVANRIIRDVSLVDKFVSSECVAAVVRKRGGFSHRLFNSIGGMERDLPALPSISRGRPMRDIVNTVANYMIACGLSAGIEPGELERLVATVPNVPDEKF